MRVAGWSLVALSLSASACAAPPPVTVAVPTGSAAAAHRIWEEAPDYMIEVTLPSTAAEATPTPAALAATLPRSESAAAVQITPSTPTPSRPVATPRPATPRPAATPPPSTPTIAPTSVANCKFSEALNEGDGTVRAAQVPPALFYGGGLCAGDRVEALIAGKSCGTSTVDAAGQWSVSIRSTAPCAPTENAVVAFTINGNAAQVSPTAVWKSGGLPPNVAGGYTLTR